MRQDAHRSRLHNTEILSDKVTQADILCAKEPVLELRDRSHLQLTRRVIRRGGGLSSETYKRETDNRTSGYCDDKHKDEETQREQVDG